MPNEIDTVRRRIIIDTPLNSELLALAELNSEKSDTVSPDDGNDKTTTESRDGVRSKKPSKHARENELRKKLKELYLGGKLIHTDIAYYVETLGIDIGDIQVNVDNYLEVLLAADKEARRRGFLF